MSGVKTARTPSISFLDPSQVKQGWEGTVKIHGSDFEKGDFPLFNGASTRTTYKSESLLEADVKNDINDITGTVGTKEVKVHTSGGTVSNPVNFVVSPK